MKLPIVATTMEPTRDEVRAAIDDSAALVRLARRWDLRGDGLRWVGKRGPAFSASNGKRG